MTAHTSEPTETSKDEQQEQVTKPNKKAKTAKSKPKKAKKGSSTVTSNDEQQNRAQRLLELLEKNETEKRDIIPGDKERRFLELAKEKLEDAIEELRNNMIEKEINRERRKQETIDYQEKTKQILSGQSNIVRWQEEDIASCLSQLQQQHAEWEEILRQLILVLQADYREKQSNQETFIKNLMEKHNKEKKTVLRDHELKIQEVEVNVCHDKKNAVLEKFGILYKKSRMMERRALAMLEENAINAEASKHQMSIIEVRFQDIKEVETSVQKVKSHLKSEEHELNLERSKSKRLQEELSVLEEDWNELQRASKPYSCKEVMTKYRRELKAVSDEHTDLTVLRELLGQAIQELEEECDELQRKAIWAVLRKKKAAAVTKTLEKKQAQLDAVPSIYSSDPEICC